MFWWTMEMVIVNGNCQQKLVKASSSPPPFKSWCYTTLQAHCHLYTIKVLCINLLSTLVALGANFTKWIIQPMVRTQVYLCEANFFWVTLLSMENMRWEGTLSSLQMEKQVPRVLHLGEARAIHMVWPWRLHCRQHLCQLCSLLMGMVMSRQAWIWWHPHQHWCVLQEQCWGLEEVRLQLSWLGLLLATTPATSCSVSFPLLQIRPCSPGWWLRLGFAQNNLLGDAECCQQCNAAWFLAVGEQSWLAFGHLLQRTPAGD